MRTRSLSRGLKRGLSVLAAGALSLGALVATPAVAQAADVSVTDAVFRWGVNAESNAAAFAPGTFNFFSAGVAEMADVNGRVNASNWQQSAGNVAIKKKQADGTLAAATFEGTKTDANGTRLTTVNGLNSGHVVEIANGTGAVDSVAGTATIQWTGTFTVVYYSGMTRFWVKDPKLTVSAGGVGKVTATLGGWGTSMEDPEKFEVLTPVANVTIADLKGVSVTEAGITATPDYLGVTTTAPGQTRTGDAWGSFPQSFVDFQSRTGQTSYWYSSGGQADVRKPASPIVVSYTAPQPPAPTITTQPQSVTADLGAQATLSVAATGSALSYQWQRSADGTAWTDVAGATSATYAFTTTKDDRGAKFRVVVTNSSGSVTSDAATLTVNVSSVAVTQAQFEWAYSGYAQQGVFGAWYQEAQGQNVSIASIPAQTVTGNPADAGKVYKGVRFDGGTGSIDPITGAGTISWTTGKWTLNAYRPTYDIAPDESLSNPILTIGADGKGTLTVDAYLGEHLDFMSGTNAVVPERGPVRTTIATFSSVTVTDGVIRVVPDFAGRVPTIPEGESTFLSCDGAGGSWPAEWLAFVGSTVRAHYYTTSCSGLNLTKPPFAFTVQTEAATPTISLQPVTVNQVPGKVATFTAAAKGNPNPTLQWQSRTSGGAWTDIAGATGGSYSVTVTEADYAREFRAVAAGTVASDAATIGRAAAPVIVTQPTVAQAQGIPGGSVTLSVEASSGLALRYQWQRGTTSSSSTFVNVEGETGRTLTLSNLATGTQPYYRVIVSNDAGSVTSQSRRIQVQAPTAPTVTTQPGDVALFEGGTASLSVLGAGYPSVTYQLERQGAGDTWTAVSAATATIPQVGGLTAADSGARFRVAISNQGVSPTVYTNAFTATVVAVSGHTLHAVAKPAPLDAAVGGTVSAGIAGYTDLPRLGSVILAVLPSDVWADRAALAGKPVADLGYPTSFASNAALRSTNGQTWQPLSIGAGALDPAKTYVVAAFYADAGNNVSADTAGDRSVPLVLAGQAVPSITTAPANKAVVSGGSVTLSAVVAGTPAPAVQWQRSVDGTSWTDLVGATSATLTVPSVTETAQYRIVATSGIGSATSAAATVTALPVPTVTVSKTANINADGETVVVRGTGFIANAPATNGTRPPLSGTFGGVYVAFGKFADVWQASKGAGSSARPVIDSADTRWVVNPANVAALGAAAVAINPDGSFEVQLKVKSGLFSTTGNYGVYTYPGSGVVYAPFETYTPVTLAEAPVAITAQPADLSAPVTPATGDAVATFTVAATGAPTPKVVWQRQQSGGSWTDIAGATAATLSLPYTQADDGARVRAVVSNGFGSVTTREAVLTVGQPAAITTAPQAATVVAGTDAVFTAATSGTNATIRWEKRAPGASVWTTVEGATGASLTVANTRADIDGTAYRIVVSSPIPATVGGAASEVASPAVTLTVQYTAIAVTEHPTSYVAPVTPATGAAQVTLRAAASGTPAVTVVQWQKRVGDGAWSDVAGATGTSFVLSYGAGDDGTSYRAAFTNAIGEVAYSHIATLAVGQPVAFTAQPESRTAQLGTDATFTVAATGTAATVQWQRKAVGGDWADIAGATSASYAVTATEQAQGVAFRAIVSGPIGTEIRTAAEAAPRTVTSSEAVLTVVDAARITAQPTSVLAPTVPATGDAVATFTVGVAGIPTPSVVWERRTGDGWANAGSGTTLSVPYTAADHLAAFRAVVSNGIGEPVVSDTVTLTLGDLPTVSVPSALTAIQGQKVTLDATVTGSLTSVQWQVLEPGASAWTNVGSALAEHTLEVAAKDVRNGQQYRAVVSSPFPTTPGGAPQAVTSGATVLTVLAPADPAVDVPNEQLPASAQIDAQVDGTTVTLNVGTEHAAQYVGVWVHSTPTFLGWHVVSLDGTVTVTLPAGLEAGAHRLVVVDAEGALVAWAGFDIAGDGAVTAKLAATGADLPYGALAAGGLLLALGGVLLLRRRTRTTV